MYIHTCTYCDITYVNYIYLSYYALLYNILVYITYFYFLLCYNILCVLVYHLKLYCILHALYTYSKKTTTNSRNGHLHCRGAGQSPGSAAPMHKCPERR